MGDIMYIY